MLDVHPPHHAPQGARDFFLHLFTITVGLLIALGLEAGAEAIHHRHERIEAEDTIRRELQDNQAKLVKMQGNTRIEIDNLDKALAFLEDLRLGKKNDPSGIKLGFSVDALQQAGWSTASVTGALSYMNYEEAQRFATAYHEQEQYEAAVAQALEEYEILETYLVKNEDPREMKPQDVETAIPDLRRAQAGLASMYDWGRGALRSYEDALK